MAVSINTYIQRARVLPQQGAVGVILEKLTAKKEDKELIKLNSLSQLSVEFDLKSTDETDKTELAILEYLLVNGVPVVAIPHKEGLALAKKLTPELSEEISFIITPGYTYKPKFKSNEENAQKDVLEGIITTSPEISLIAAYCKDNNLQYIFDLEVDLDEDVVVKEEESQSDENPEGTPEVKKKMSELLQINIDNKKVPELNANTEMTFGSYYPSSSSNFKFDDLVFPASLPLVTGKAKNLINKTPWIPLAGEETGNVTTVKVLKQHLSKEEKNILQAFGANVLGFKRSVGHLFMTQNTLFPGRLNEINKNNPLIRSHAVSLSLWIKLQLNDSLGKYQYRSNSSKTWILLEMELNKYFQTLKNTFAIEKYGVYTGLSVMTKEDINNGIMRASVWYKPIRVTEEIELNLFISEDDVYINEISQLEGGIL